jgi:hypothetical protein
VDEHQQFVLFAREHGRESLRNKPSTYEDVL